jgi:hypothetical protein
MSVVKREWKVWLLCPCILLSSWQQINLQAGVPWSGAEISANSVWFVSSENRVLSLIWHNTVIILWLLLWSGLTLEIIKKIVM